MSFLIVGGALALFVFGLAYIRRGRFGLTVLALGAGYVLADLWADILTELARAAAIHIPLLPIEAVVAISLVIAPCLIVLLFGQKKQGIIPRPIAAALTAVFVLALLLPLFTPDSQSSAIYGAVEDYRHGIITAVLVLGLFDAVFSRLPKPPKHSKD